MSLKLISLAILVILFYSNSSHSKNIHVGLIRTSILEFEFHSKIQILFNNQQPLSDSEAFYAKFDEIVKLIRTNMEVVSNEHRAAILSLESKDIRISKLNVCLKELQTLADSEQNELVKLALIALISIINFSLNPTNIKLLEKYISDMTLLCRSKIRIGLELGLSACQTYQKLFSDEDIDKDKAIIEDYIQKVESFLSINLNQIHYISSLRQLAFYSGDLNEAISSIILRENFTFVSGSLNVLCLESIFTLSIIELAKSLFNPQTGISVEGNINLINIQDQKDNFPGNQEIATEGGNYIPDDSDDKIQDELFADHEKNIDFLLQNCLILNALMQ